METKLTFEDFSQFYLEDKYNDKIIKLICNFEGYDFILTEKYVLCDAQFLTMGKRLMDEENYLIFNLQTVMQEHNIPGFDRIPCIIIEDNFCKLTINEEEFGIDYHLNYTLNKFINKFPDLKNHTHFFNSYLVDFIYTNDFKKVYLEIDKYQNYNKILYGVEANLDVIKELFDCIEEDNFLIFEIPTGYKQVMDLDKLPIDVIQHLKKLHANPILVDEYYYQFPPDAIFYITNGLDLIYLFLPLFIIKKDKIKYLYMHGNNYQNSTILNFDPDPTTYCNSDLCDFLYKHRNDFVRFNSSINETNIKDIITKPTISELFK